MVIPQWKYRNRLGLHKHYRCIDNLLHMITFVVYYVDTTYKYYIIRTELYIVINKYEVHYFD